MKQTNDLEAENERLRYLVGEKIGHPSVRDLLDAEVSRQLAEQKALGEKKFISDEDIKRVIREVLKDHDENPDKYWKNLYHQIDELLAQITKLSNPTLENNCMIGQRWFMKGTPVADLIEHAENVYKAEAVAQNSKIEFCSDDNEIWFAHDVPFYGRVQLQRFVKHGLIEWDIHFNDCWQGPFDSKASAIQHLEECIAEKRQEAEAGI